MQTAGGAAATTAALRFHVLGRCFFLEINPDSFEIKCDKLSRLGGDPGEDPGHAGESTSPGWERLGAPERAGKGCGREGSLGLLPPRPDPGISG